ncbi:MAG: right-handed parallel beta-helix repeat-containing protein [Anaerolineales bacterium]
MLNRKIIHLFFAVILALSISAVTTTLASADESQPPETSPAEVAPGDGQADASQAEAGEDAPPPDEGATGQEDGTAAQTTDDQTPPAAEPLQSEPQAPSAIPFNPGDSFWCPAGQAATPGENGCTQAFGSMTGLLGFLLANETDPLYQQAGVIYVAVGDYSGGETSINFNAFGFVNLSQYDLALQGGWDPNAPTIDPDDRTTFTIPITIGLEENPWTGALLVSNINISGSGQRAALTLVSQSDVTVTNVQLTGSDAGLVIVADGDVNLENVEANQNRTAGARIDAGGDVVITDSTFNDNGAVCGNTVVGFGLYVTSDGDVAMTGVQASRNRLYGGRVQAAGSLSISQSDFSENRAYTCSWCGGNYVVYGYGLRVDSAATVTLNGVRADRNYLYGAFVQSDGWVLVVNSSFSNNRFDRSSRNQVGYGLNIVSGSYVTLSGVQANDNSLYGTTIQAAGDVAISNGTFSGHRLYSCSSSHECGGGCTPYGYGLKVVTNGNIYLYQVTADRNALYGAYLKASGDVFVYEGSFSQNAFAKDNLRVGYGLEIISGGTVGLTNVAANANNLYGARIQANGDVSIYTSSFSDNHAYTGSTCSGYTAYGYGLQVTAGGNIQLDGVQAEHNYLYGTWLKAGVNVSVNNSSFSDNAFRQSQSLQVGYGLKVVSGGFVSLSGVLANNNRLFGADIQAVGDVSIATASFSGHDLYTCSQNNYECGGCTPYGYGLKVVTKGTIYLYDVTAENNVLYGAYLKTDGDVYVTSGNFSHNAYSSGKTRDGYGLRVISGGNVWLWDVQAVENNLFGAKIQAGGNVAIDASNFSNNGAYTYSYCGGYTVYGYGLLVESKGQIHLSGVLAEGNYLYGTNLKAGGDITISDSSFSDNHFALSSKAEVGYGLKAVSGGNVSMVNVAAYDNSLYGAFVQAAGDVTIEDSAFTGHLFYKCTYCGGCVGGYGLQVIAGGSIVLNYVSAEENATYGARLTAGEDVLVTGGVFSNNARDAGLSVTAPGAVQLVSLIAFGNGSSGAVVSNRGAVTVTGGLYKNNQQSGLSIKTSGNVALNGLTAQGNASHGVSVVGNCCINVEVTDGAYVQNGGYGLKVVNGTLTQSGAPVFADNTLGGVFVDGGLCNPRPPSNPGGGCKGRPWRR